MNLRQGLVLGGLVLFVCVGVGVGMLLFHIDLTQRPAFNPPVPPQQFQPAPAFAPAPAPIVVAEPMTPAQAALLDEVRRQIDDGALFTAAFDVKRLAKEIGEMGAIVGPPTPRDLAFINQHLPSVTTQLMAPFACHTWAFGPPHWVQPNDECVVLAEVFDPRFHGSKSVRVRWWLRQQQGRWQLYDMENLTHGGRLSTLLAVGLEDRHTTPSMTTQFTEAYTALLNRETDAVQRFGARRDVAKLPLLYRSVVDGWQGLAWVDVFRHPEAWPHFQRAMQRDPRNATVLWQQANIAQRTRQFEETHRLALRYTELVPNDDQGFVLAGNANVELQDFNTTSDLFRSALKLNPNNTAALDGLRVSLLPNELHELGPRLLKMRHPDRELHHLVSMALGGEHFEAVRVYVDAFRKEFPDHYEGWFQQARLHVFDREIPEANRELQRVLSDPRVAKQREHYRETLLTYAAARGQAVEMYRVLPVAQQRESFRLLADEMLNERRLEDEPQPYEALLAAHKEKYPGDPWLDFFQAELHLVHNENAAAERLFAKAMAAKLTPGEQKRMAEARVYNLVSMGQYQTAYEQVPPPRDTFRLLMLYTRPPMDFAKVIPVIEAHAKADPTDPKLPLWQGRIAHHRGQFAEALKAFDKFQKNSALREEYSHSFDEALVRTLLRLDRPQEAKRRLDASAHLEYSSTMKLLYAAAVGDVKQVTNMMGALAVNLYLLNELYNDADVMFFLQKPAFKGLLEKHPRPKLPMQEQP